IGLQEIHARSPSGAEGQAHELAALLGGYEVYFVPARIEPSGECEGVALLSRYKARKVEGERFSFDPKDTLDSFGPRAAVAATFALRSGAVDVFVTHLTLSEKARKRNVPELLSFMGKIRDASGSRGAILLGDFNALPSDPAIRPLEETAAPAGWQDTWTA